MARFSFLERYKGRGRHPVHSRIGLLKALLYMELSGIPSVHELLRILGRDPYKMKILGLESLPHDSVFTRYKRELGEHMDKMNHMYGVRVSQSFCSEESWYEINEYGGKLLMVWGIWVAIAGVCLMFIRIGDGIDLLIFVVLVASLIVPMGFTYRYAKNFKPTAS